MAASFQLHCPVFSEPWFASVQSDGTHNPAPQLQSFEAYRNTCSGAVFIVASGPSTKTFPLERFAGYPMMALNGSICRFADAGLRPRFYLCDDSSFVRNRTPLLEQAAALAEHLLLSPRVIDTLLGLDLRALDGRSLFKLQRAGRTGQNHLSPRQFAWSMRNDPDFTINHSWWRQKPNRIGFSRNLSKGYFNARTIPYAAVQLAYHLGYSKVFLVGLDLSSRAGRFYESCEGGVPSRLDGDYDEYILPSFRLLAQKVINPQFQVFNLSQGSRLPATLVPQIDVDQLERLLASE